MTRIYLRNVQVHTIRIGSRILPSSDTTLISPGPRQAVTIQRLITAGAAVIVEPGAKGPVINAEVLAASPSDEACWFPSISTTSCFSKYAKSRM